MPIRFGVAEDAHYHVPLLVSPVSPIRPIGAADARRDPLPAARQGGEASRNFAPTLTLLDYLRLTERATGTKEGCAEGDCGACTVVLRRLRGERLVYEPVNACILFAGQADGCEIITVEDLARDGTLHPVQQAMVDQHGSQCGFCTPGFVMALFALYQRPTGAVTRDGGQRLDRRQPLPLHRLPADRRCGARGLRGSRANDRFSRRGAGDARARSPRCDDGEDIFVGDERALLRRAGERSTALAELYDAHPDATLVAGATDVGLWVTKQLRDLPKIIWLGRVHGLDEIEDRRDAVSFGATRHAIPQAMPYLAALDPRPRRADAPLRLGMQVRAWRHRRRQHRQRLADRRHCRRR